MLMRDGKGLTQQRIRNSIIDTSAREMEKPGWASADIFRTTL
jgi:hypothetical protein